MEQEQRSKLSLIRQLFPKRTRIFALALVVMVSGGLLYHFHGQSVGPKDVQKAAQAEAQALVAVVGKLIVLPADEQPVIATVADPSKLKDQPFFANAKKGDKVLIYNKARKAILYDPVAGKIIDVAPLSIGAQSTPRP